MDKLKHQGSWGELELEKELDLEIGIDKNLMSRRAWRRKIGRSLASTSRLFTGLPTSKSMHRWPMSYLDNVCPTKCDNWWTCVQYTLSFRASETMCSKKILPPRLLVGGTFIDFVVFLFICKHSTSIFDLFTGSWSSFGFWTGWSKGDSSSSSSGPFSSASFNSGV